MELSNKTIKLAKKLKKQATIYVCTEIASTISFFIALMIMIFVLIINSNLVGLPFMILFLVIFIGSRIANFVFLIFMLTSSSALKDDFENARNVFVFSIILLILGWIFAILILPIIVFLILIIVYSNKTYKEIVDSQNVIIENHDEKNAHNHEKI